MPFVELIFSTKYRWPESFSERFCKLGGQILPFFGKGKVLLSKKNASVIFTVPTLAAKELFFFQNNKNIFKAQGAMNRNS